VLARQAPTAVFLEEEPCEHRVDFVADAAQCPRELARFNEAVEGGDRKQRPVSRVACVVAEEAPVCRRLGGDVGCRALAQRCFDIQRAQRRQLVAPELRLLPRALDAVSHGPQPHTALVVVAFERIEPEKLQPVDAVEHALEEEVRFVRAVAGAVIGACECDIQRRVELRGAAGVLVQPPVEIVQPHEREERLVRRGVSGASKAACQ
jgi:hypothetical protein